MIRPNLLAALFALTQASFATDFEIPNPVTYEWTVKATQKVIPTVDLKKTKIRDLLGYIGNSMVMPIGLKHEIPDHLLDQKVTWHFKDILWIDLVAKIADATNSEILIEKGAVKLIYKKPNKAQQDKPR